MAYKQKHKYGYRDSLDKGDPEKVIYGKDFDDEFEAIEEAFDVVPGAGGDPIAPDQPGFEDVVFQNRAEDQQVISKFTFAVDGQDPLTVENTGIWADVNYIKYVSADTTWRAFPALDIDGNLTVDGTIDATGDIHTDSNVTVDGDIEITGSITIGGNVIDGDGNTADKLPHGSIDGATLRWNDTDEKWEQSNFLKVPSGANSGNVEVTLTSITPQGAIYNSRGDGTGLSFDIDAIAPMKNAARIGNEVELGTDTHPFKDGRFGGTLYANEVEVGDSGVDVDRKQLLRLRAARPWTFVQNGTGSESRLQLYSEVGGNKVFSIGGKDAGTENVIEFSSETGAIKTIGGIHAEGNLSCKAITATANISTEGNVIAYKASDERLKDEIAPMPLGLIDAINPSTWKWKSDGRSSGGVIAQQLQQIGLDDWVRASPDGELGVDYEALIGVLIAEVQALKGQINDNK